MEKPAVCMNEAAFKMLLEALTGKTIGGSSPADDGVSSAAVDQFLKGWEQSKDVQKNPRGRQATRNFEAEYETLKDYMVGHGPMTLKEIWEIMTNQGLWDCPLKGAAQKLSGIIDRFGGIEKIGRGLYEMNGSEDRGDE